MKYLLICILFIISPLLNAADIPLKGGTSPVPTKAASVMNAPNSTKSKCPCEANGGVRALSEGQFVCCDGSKDLKFRTFVCTGCVDPNIILEDSAQDAVNPWLSRKNNNTAIVKKETFKAPACCTDKSEQLLPSQLSKSTCCLLSCSQQEKFDEKKSIAKQKNLPPPQSPCKKESGFIK